MLSNRVEMDQLDFYPSSERSSLISATEPLLSDMDSRDKVGELKVKSTSGKTPGFVFTLTFFSAIGGFLFGYDTGVVSGAMLLLKDYFHLNSLMQELIVSVTIAAAALFALAGGFANDYLGRKLTTVIGSVVFTLGAVLLGAAQNTAMLIAGRLIVGAGIGLYDTVISFYSAGIYLIGRPTVAVLCCAQVHLHSEPQS